MKSKNNTLNKISDLIDNCSREEFETFMFPKKESFENFKHLIEHERNKRDSFMKYDTTRLKVQIMTDFFKRLEKEGIYDIAFDQLHKDRYKLTKKIDRGNNMFDGLTKIWDKKIIDSDIETICHAYAQCYERFCKRYLKPLASKIAKRSVTKCGKSIDIITKYEPETEKVIKPCMIPQIRNSINHSDYDYDRKTNLIAFEDEDKPAIEITPERLKTIIHLTMENEMCFSIAEFQAKESLLKAIIVESEKCEKLCKILGLDFDKLMIKYLGRGISLFEVNWRLEQYIKHKIKPDIFI